MIGSIACLSPLSQLKGADARASHIVAARFEGLRRHEIFGCPGDFVLRSFKVIEESGILPHYMLSHELGVGLAADALARYHVDLGVAVARPVWPTPLSALARGRDRRRPGRASEIAALFFTTKSVR